MSDSDSSSSSSILPGALPPPFTIQRKRTHMACSNCRKRKIKCNNINDKSEHDPCERCLKRRLECEYVAVSDPPPRLRKPHGGSTKNNLTRPPSSEPPAFHASGLRLHSYADPYLSYDVVARRESAFGGDDHGGHSLTSPRMNTHANANTHLRPLPSAQHAMEYPDSTFIQSSMGFLADNYAPSFRTTSNSSNPGYSKLEPGVEWLSWEQGVAFTHSCSFCQGTCFCGQHQSQSPVESNNRGQTIGCGLTWY